jgi:hypothetical protein
MYLKERRNPVFPNTIEVAAAVLQDPISIHEDMLRRDFLYVLADAEMLRRRSLLASQSTPFVDAVIELRSVENNKLPRLFHLSPRRRNFGGSRLWP